MDMKKIYVMPFVSVTQMQGETILAGSGFETTVSNPTYYSEENWDE